MNITQVKIFPVEEDKLKAFVSVVFDQCFMVNDIKVIQGKDGLFLSMPSRRKKTGEFKDVAHPLNNETRRQIEETVLREYRSVVTDPTPRRPDRLGEEEPESSDSSLVVASAVAPAAPAHVWQGGGENGLGRSMPSSEPVPVATAVADQEVSESGETSLEEVQEKHLRDSFWTVS